MPAKGIENIARGFGRMRGTDTTPPDFIRGITTIANEIVPGGANLYTINEAKKKLSDGIISDGELLQAMIFGWASTNSGKAYLRQRQGGGGGSVSLPPQAQYRQQRNQRQTNQRQPARNRRQR
jgi:hypothetical protein